jgi:outer membrane protein assembly factor BamD (BamD/ComL family)
LLLGFFASCASAPPPVPPDASAQKIIQLAQERYDAYDLNGAQYYYQVLLDRYGSDPEYMLNAKYEMAFIEYKKGNKEKAVAGFKEILARYDAPDGQTLSQTWKVLSEKLLAKLTGGK